MTNQDNFETPGYIICTSPRSGSTLLCSMLNDTGKAGSPDSFFHEPRFMQEWADVWQLPAKSSVSTAVYEAAYLGATVTAGHGGTPVFGMRLQQPYLPLLAAILCRLHPALSTDAARLEHVFGPLRYVYLTRRDKVAQAVSLVKARQTGLWHRHANGSERERSGPPAEAAYHFPTIEAEVDAFTRADRAWHEWFAREGIEPLRIDYEGLAADPAGTVVRLCAALNIALPDGVAPKPPTAKLADASSLAWAHRYRTEARLD